MNDQPEDATPDRDASENADSAAQDLRATVDAIRADLGRLALIEDEKQALDPADPRVDAASDEAVELADRIARETRAQRQLGRELT